MGRKAVQKMDEYSIKNLCGSWYDDMGSSYDVSLSKENKVVVSTTRKSLENITTIDLIRFDAVSGWIIWGRSGLKSQYWLSEMDSHSLKWVRDGSKAFEWRRAFPVQEKSQPRKRSKPRARKERGAGKENEESTPYELTSVCGTWEDTQSSKVYTVAFDAGAMALTANVHQKSGEHKVFTIRADEDSGWIVWGKSRPKYYLVDLRYDMLVWESDSKNFTWTRRSLANELDEPRSPESKPSVATASGGTEVPGSRASVATASGGTEVPGSRGQGLQSSDTNIVSSSFISSPNFYAASPPRRSAIQKDFGANAFAEDQLFDLIREGRADAPASSDPVDFKEYFKSNSTPELTSVKAQLEYYFSDENLQLDAYLKSLMMPIQGWVKLENIHAFPRMKAHPFGMLQMAAASSDILELDGMTLGWVRIADEARRRRWTFMGLT